jgi:hypothetical protein
LEDFPVAPIGHRQTRSNDGSKSPKQKQKRQVHTGNLERQNKEIRRASEQTSPQVACVVGHPAMGRGRRIEQWQLAQSAVSIPGAPITAGMRRKRGEDGPGQDKGESPWTAGFKAKA